MRRPDRRPLQSRKADHCVRIPHSRPQDSQEFLDNPYDRQFVGIAA